jgi:excinuclease ABC subunit C
LVPVVFDGAAGVGEWLSDRRGKRCEVLAPQRGAKADLLRLAFENAQHCFREERRAADDVEERLTQLQKRLRLAVVPHRIECCDISHLGGTDTVGAIVALKDGQPDKKRYRTFRVRTVSQGDDYGAMYEVLARRFRRGRAAEEAQRQQGTESEAQAEGTRDRIDWDLPDLFVVDGGRGQLNVALAAARDLGLHELPIVALAKEKTIPGYAGHAAREEGDDGEDRDDEGAERAAEEPSPGSALTDANANANATPTPTTADADANAPDTGAKNPNEAVATEQPASPKRRTRGEGRKPDDLVDRVYLPGQKNGIALKPNSAPLFFLARARDEAHRFSNRARERLGKARKLRSELDDIPGIGPVTRRSLLRTLGSLEAIRKASDEALLAVPGVNQRILRALRVHIPAPHVIPPTDGSGAPT